MGNDADGLHGKGLSWHANESCSAQEYRRETSGMERWRRRTSCQWWLGLAIARSQRAGAVSKWSAAAEGEALGGVPDGHQGHGAVSVGVESRGVGGEPSASPAGGPELNGAKGIGGSLADGVGRIWGAQDAVRPKAHLQEVFPRAAEEGWKGGSGWGCRKKRVGGEDTESVEICGRGEIKFREEELADAGARVELSGDLTARGRVYVAGRGSKIAAGREHSTCAAKQGHIAGTTARVRSFC
ncbi:hypothetical protein B0H17DRAFT_1173595 [Mycena rosella]|uniref:Uncharacterized protein n=1 Tax=Mycena rosella TaxID=1033263 RepID=A0AAD7H3I7_MYCRO|nr:hypothetical protein B0H17DRAFT_1173595 [Mycena rosella]